MGTDVGQGEAGVSATRREKRSAKKLDRFKEAISKGEEPSRFYHNLGKAGLAISVLIMMAVWIWILYLYRDRPDAALPIMLLGMVMLSYDGILIGILEYWLYEKESTHIQLGHLSPMPFHWGEWKATAKVPYQSKDGSTLLERWELGRLGKTKWMWSTGGGKKGYYACKILQRYHIDDSHNPVTVKKEDAELAGYWEGGTYRIPMDFSRTYADRLKEEIVRALRNDVRFKEDESPIYAAEIPLPEKFRGMEALSDMQVKLHDRNEEIAHLRGKIRRMVIDESIRKSTEPDVKREVHHYHTGKGE